MNIDKKAGHIDPKVALSQAEPVSYTHRRWPTGDLVSVS